MELTLRSAIPSYSASTHRRLRTLAQRNLFVPSSQIKSSIFSSTRSRINPQLVSTKPPPSRAAAQMGDNGSSSTSTASQLVSVGGARCGEVKRVTKETDVFVRINLDGTGIADSSSGIPFLDHMLDQLASHGLFDVHVRATGDVHIDDHHTNEDVALAIGTALLQALGDRKGIHRFGDFSAPLDEALIHVALSFSISSWLVFHVYTLYSVIMRVLQLVEHFFQSLVNTSGMTLHIRQVKYFPEFQ
ncbi:Imidazoleglycerol-phosphate dehydratase 2, chloroplastic [Linum grandiflorum]